MIENDIIKFLYTTSNGKIDLSHTHARAIVNMVIGKGKKIIGAYVLLHELDNQTKTFRLVRTIQTTDELIKEAIIKALETPPDMNFYYYKLFNSLQEYEGCIYSANPNLF